MAVDEVQRLIMQVEGEVKVKTLTDSLNAQKKTMMELIELQSKGPLTGAQQQQFTAAAAGAVQSTAQLNELTKSMRGLMGSQGMQQIGYGLQDIFAAQGGFAQKLNAASNNIQMLAVSMGVGGGWFLAFTALTSALQLAANNWDKINAWIKDLPSPEELKKKADEAKARMAEYEKLRAEPKPGEAAAAGGAAAAMKAYGLGKLGAGLEREISAKGMPFTPEETAMQEQISGALYPESARIKALQSQLDESRRNRAKQEAARVMTEAQQPGPAGEAARRRIGQLGLGAALQGPGPSDVGIGPPEPDWAVQRPAPGRPLMIPGGVGIPHETEAEINARRAAAFAGARAQRAEAQRAEAETPAAVRPSGALGPEEMGGEIERLAGKVGQAYEMMSAGMLSNRNYKAFQAMEARLNQLVSMAEQRAQYDASNEDLMTRVQMLGQGPVGMGVYPPAPRQW